MLPPYLVFSFSRDLLILRDKISLGLANLPLVELFSLKTGRREVPGSTLGRDCRPSRSEFFVAFSKTRVNTGYDPLVRPLWRTIPLQAQVSQADN